ncbi:MAG TPA: hypothetical protein PKA32_03390 [Candidatus Gracilibacteria bacterium]|nr:hypothetical protein [Candidatus Gracilibacteria bacterium]
MRKIILTISISLLGFLAGFMGFAAVTTQAQSQEDPRRTDLCAYDPSAESKNIYTNPELSLETIMTTYHERTNEKFNTYIKEMITKQNAESKSVPENSFPPDLPDDAGNLDAMKQFCDENRKNYSTFCVAANMISDTTNGDGYLQYAQALNCRRDKIFDTVQEESLYQDYGNALIVGEENEQQFEQTLQYQKALEVSARVDAINREIDVAKRALDQTLSAYNELKTAWPMHVRFIEIYQDLVKYRDKMIEVRHQVEEFPAKFIDATTTACT